MTNTTCGKGGSPCQNCQAQGGTCDLYTGTCNLGPQWQMMVLGAQVVGNKDCTCGPDTCDLKVKVEVSTFSGETNTVNDNCWPTYNSAAVKVPESVLLSSTVIYTVLHDDPWPNPDDVLGSCSTTWSKSELGVWVGDIVSTCTGAVISVKVATSL